MRVTSFEGCMGAGKTSLVRFFSRELRVASLLEKSNTNPFLEDFYAGLDVKLETEMTFLLIHYSQLKSCTRSRQDTLTLADFSIEKDLVFARLNLQSDQLGLFEQMYNHAIEHVGLPDVVIYLDLSFDTLRSRITQRGRSYEIGADPQYFKEYNDSLKEYFQNESQSQVYIVNVDDLELDPTNQRLGEIRDIVLEAQQRS